MGTSRGASFSLRTFYPSTSGTMDRMCFLTVKNCTSEPITVQQAKAKTSFMLFKESPIESRVMPSATFQIHAEATPLRSSSARSSRSQRKLSDSILLRMSTGSVSSVSTSCCLVKDAAKSSYVIEVDDSYILNVVHERIEGQNYSVTVTVNPVCKAPGALSRSSVDELIRDYLAVHSPWEDNRTNQPESLSSRRGSFSNKMRVMLNRRGSLSSISSSKSC
eukprot:1190230-Prorocentrum_minimum.AAC.1